MFTEGAARPRAQAACTRHSSERTPTVGCAGGVRVEGCPTTKATLCHRSVVQSVVILRQVQPSIFIGDILGKHSSRPAAAQRCHCLRHRLALYPRYVRGMGLERLRPGSCPPPLAASFTCSCLRKHTSLVKMVRVVRMELTARARCCNLGGRRLRAGPAPGRHQRPPPYPAALPSSASHCGREAGHGEAATEACYITSDCGNVSTATRPHYWGRLTGCRMRWPSSTLGGAVPSYREIHADDPEGSNSGGSCCHAVWAALAAAARGPAAEYARQQPPRVRSPAGALRAP
jgi:hypothetical protein